MDAFVPDGFASCRRDNPHTQARVTREWRSMQAGEICVTQFGLTRATAAIR
jgi:hypothetical protein